MPRLAAMKALFAGQNAVTWRSPGVGRLTFLLTTGPGHRRYSAQGSAILQRRIDLTLNSGREIKMTKQLIALAIAAAFGIAHAADVKPATETNPAAAPVAAAQKAEAPRSEPGPEARRRPLQRPRSRRTKTAGAKPHQHTRHKGKKVESLPRPRPNPLLR